jgi:hypothetical protein
MNTQDQCLEEKRISDKARDEELAAHVTKAPADLPYKYKRWIESALLLTKDTNEALSMAKLVEMVVFDAGYTPDDHPYPAIVREAKSALKAYLKHDKAELGSCNQGVYNHSTEAAAIHRLKEEAKWDRVRNLRVLGERIAEALGTDVYFESYSGRFHMTVEAAEALAEKLGIA